jgi:hypothetical protein
MYVSTLLAVVKGYYVCTKCQYMGQRVEIREIGVGSDRLVCKRRAAERVLSIDGGSQYAPVDSI